MKYQAILFDMDGTLLPMNQQQFVRAYFGALAKRFAPKGYEPKAMIDAIWKGTAAMVQNDGAMPNCERFWEVFASIYGQDICDRDRPEFDDFYLHEFAAAKAATGFNPAAKRCIETLKAKGYPLVLATNPIFPMVAQHARIGWAGVAAERFEHITSYENSCHCKPNPAYYADICEKLQLDPAKCLMVGNDFVEDGAARKLGMDLYLITDCLIAPENADLSEIPHGSLNEFADYCDTAL